MLKQFFDIPTQGGEHQTRFRLRAYIIGKLLSLILKTHIWVDEGLVNSISDLYVN